MNKIRLPLIKRGKPSDGGKPNCGAGTKHTRGFSLMEAVIALSIWMILSMGVIVIWQHASSRAGALIERQSAFESTRSSLDALMVNIQMAQSIRLEVGPNYVLSSLTLTELNPQGLLHDYVFTFDINASPGTPKHHRLEFGLNNEFASGIALVRVEPVGDRHMHITIISDCEHAITLEGRVDIRYKQLTVVRGL